MITATFLFQSIEHCISRRASRLFVAGLTAEQRRFFAASSGLNGRRRRRWILDADSSAFHICVLEYLMKRVRGLLCRDLEIRNRDALSHAYLSLFIFSSYSHHTRATQRTRTRSTHDSGHERVTNFAFSRFFAAKSVQSLDVTVVTCVKKNFYSRM